MQTDQDLFAIDIGSITQSRLPIIFDCTLNILSTYCYARVSRPYLQLIRVLQLHRTSIIISLHSRYWVCSVGIMPLLACRTIDNCAKGYIVRLQQWYTGSAVLWGNARVTACIGCAQRGKKGSSLCFVERNRTQNSTVYNRYDQLFHDLLSLPMLHHYVWSEITGYNSLQHTHNFIHQIHGR